MSIILDVVKDTRSNDIGCWGFRDVEVCCLQVKSKHEVHVDPNDLHEKLLQTETLRPTKDPTDSRTLNDQ